jgi:hypothetical protein
MVTVNGNAAEFCFFRPEAGHVWLVGDFNNWRPEELKMMRQANGDWLAQLQLAPGEYIPEERMGQEREMSRWQYEITTSTVDEIFETRDRLGLAVEDKAASRFICDATGHCFLDEMPNPEVVALISIRNPRGGEGWGLVQFVYHKGDMVCFWTRQVDRTQQCR